MRWLGSIVLTATLSGCAARTAPVRIISTEWSTVQALSPGTDVTIVIDGGEVRHGRLRETTSDTLTLWERHGAAIIPRARIARVAVRTSTGATKTPNVIRGAIVGAIITGALAWFASSIEEGESPNSGSWGMFFLGTAGGAAIGSAQPPAEQFREQLIYIRP